MKKNQDELRQDEEEVENVDLALLSPRFQFTIRGLMWTTFWTAVGMLAWTHIPPDGDQHFAFAYLLGMVFVISLFAAIGGLTDKPWGMLLAAVIVVIGLSFLLVPAIVFAKWIKFH